MRPLQLGLVSTCWLFSSMPVVLYGQERDTPPSTPAALIGKAYNHTSGALAWHRSNDDMGVRSYEVSRDGEILVVADRLSYIDEALQAGKGYNYSVVAIDTVGQRSERAVARIETPDAPPASPSGLFARLHTPSEVSLGWNRSGAFGERYEVKRDGVTVAQTGGISFSDDSLADGRRYLFEVIAVNRQGQRSASSRILVDAELIEGSEEAGASADTAVADSPAAPTDLRANVYSPTAAGIGWARAEVRGMQYEVRRDGVVVAITDGISHVAEDLSPGHLYRYVIVAIDSENARSPASVIGVQTPGIAKVVQATPEAEQESGSGVGQTSGQASGQSSGPDNGSNLQTDDGSVLSSLGIEAARDSADALVSGGFLDEYLAIDAAVANLPPAVEGQTTRLDCSGGGIVVVTDNAGPRSLVRAFSFERCELMDRILDGRLERTTDTMIADSTRSESLRLVFDGLTVRQGVARSLTLYGSSVRVATETRVQACIDRPDTLFNVVNEFASARWTTTDGTASVSAANYTERLSDAQPERSTAQDCKQVRSLSFDGTARVSASRFGEGSASLSKRGQIVRDTRPDGLAGATASLTAGYGDGSSFVLTVLFDGDGTVQMDIVANRDARSFEDAYRFEPSVPFIAP